MESFVTLVSEIGIPAAVVACSFYFIKYMFDKGQDEREALQRSYHDDLQLLRTTIEKNTDVIQILMERMK